MKIISILIVITFTFSTQRLEAQVTLQDSLVNMNLVSYLNKPIDSILNNLPTSHDNYIIGPALTVTQGAKIVVTYNRVNYIITIVPNTRNFITVLNYQKLPFDQAWPLNLLKKENLGSVEIMGPNGTIINSAGL